MGRYRCEKCNCMGAPVCQEFMDDFEWADFGEYQVVEDRGGVISMRQGVASLEQCQQYCNEEPGCESIKYCYYQGTSSDCYMYDRRLMGNETTQKHDICTTYYKKLKQATTTETPILPTIAEIALRKKYLSTLLQALRAASLMDKLGELGKRFTVFAPEDDAFARMPADFLSELLKPENVEKLKGILLTHVLDNVIKAENIPEGVTTKQTVGGETVSITKSGNGDVFVKTVGHPCRYCHGTVGSRAKVVHTNIFASNGVVHIIDTVLEPGKRKV